MKTAIQLTTSLFIMFFHLSLWAQVGVNPAYFAEGTTGNGWDTHYYITNNNPNPSGVVVVKVEVLGETKSSVGFYTVNSLATVGIAISNLLPQQAHSVIISTVGVNYLSIKRYVMSPTQLLTGTGPALSPNGYRSLQACGFPGAAVNYISILNPSISNNAAVHVSMNNGFHTIINVPPKTRRTVPTSSLTGGIILSFGAGVVVEQAVYNAQHNAGIVCQN